MPWALLSESTRPALPTAVTRVESTGLCDAAVATGSVAIPSKLPGPSFGTAAQADPNTAPEAIIESEGDAAGEDAAAGDEVAAAGADDVVVEEPQAASARGTAATAAAMPARRRSRVVVMGISW
jgi:hypothetical protein